MSRLREHLRTVTEDGNKALGIFLTSGFPEMNATPSIMQAIDESGADFIELGMPFSDPLAEGLPIQRSSERALSNGVTMRDTFRFAASFREHSDTPLLLMGYTNPIVRIGVSNFFDLAQSSGVDGVILPDLPIEESDLMASAAEKHEIDVIQLIAPTTPDERISRIDAMSGGFVYAVSVTGLTGTNMARSTGTSDYLERARTLVRKNPLLVGFGIASHDDFLKMSVHTDGCIVGSALINLLSDLWQDRTLSTHDRINSVKDFVSTLKCGSPFSSRS